MHVLSLQLLSLLVATTLFLSGCSKKEGAQSAPPPTPPETGVPKPPTEATLAAWFAAQEELKTKGCEFSGAVLDCNGARKQIVGAKYDEVLQRSKEARESLTKFAETMKGLNVTGIDEAILVEMRAQIKAAREADQLLAGAETTFKMGQPRLAGELMALKVVASQAKQALEERQKAVAKLKNLGVEIKEVAGSEPTFEVVVPDALKAKSTVIDALHNVVGSNGDEPIFTDPKMAARTLLAVGLVERIKKLPAKHTQGDEFDIIRDLKGDADLLKDVADVLEKELDRHDQISTQAAKMVFTLENSTAIETLTAALKRLEALGYKAKHWNPAVSKLSEEFAEQVSQKAGVPIVIPGSVVFEPKALLGKTEMELTDGKAQLEEVAAQLLKIMKLEGFEGWEEEPGFHRDLLSLVMKLSEKAESMANPSVEEMAEAMTVVSMDRFLERVSKIQGHLKMLLENEAELTHDLRMQAGKTDPSLLAVGDDDGDIMLKLPDLRYMQVHSVFLMEMVKRMSADINPAEGATYAVKAASFIKKIEAGALYALLIEITGSPGESTVVEARKRVIEEADTRFKEYRWKAADPAPAPPLP